MLNVGFAIPGDLQAPTGGYAYARELFRRFAAHDIQASHIQLPAGFPFPDANDIADTESRFAQIGPQTPLLIDGLAYGAFPEHLAAALPHPLVALIHHPLARETGLSDEQVASLKQSERAALRRADRVITTSTETADILARCYDVSADKLSVAEPGTPAPRRHRGSQSATMQLLAVGAVSHRKGYDVLCSALAGLSDETWHLTIVGDTTRNPAVTETLRRQIADDGLADRVTLTGAATADELDRQYHNADIFVHAAHYEGYGMVLTEALSRGLPIVTTSNGAAAEAISHDAAIKVPADDVSALAAALAAVIGDAAQRRHLSDCAWAAAQTLPTWDQTTQTVAKVLRGIAE
ncbi:MAG: glycosyltransferase family 4 protein [Pseudomonadota bacterium]